MGKEEKDKEKMENGRAREGGRDTKENKEKWRMEGREGTSRGWRKRGREGERMKGEKGEEKKKDLNDALHRCS